MRKKFTIKDMNANLSKVSLKATPIESLLFALNTDKYRNDEVDFEIDHLGGLKLFINDQKFYTDDYTKRELGEFIKLAHICEGR